MNLDVAIGKILLIKKILAVSTHPTCYEIFGGWVGSSKLKYTGKCLFGKEEYYIAIIL